MNKQDLSDYLVRIQLNLNSGAIPDSDRRLRVWCHKHGIRDSQCLGRTQLLWLLDEGQVRSLDRQLNELANQR